MQNKDDSHRPCFALFRRVGTLLVVQLKDILSRHLRATLPEGESYPAEWEHFLPYKLKISSLDAARHSPRRGKLFLLRATLHEGESNKKIVCYNKMVALLSF